MLVADCVDIAIFSLLDAIDNDLVDLTFRDEKGGIVKLADAGRGEMAGSYIGGDWIDRYSSERNYNHFL